MSQLPPEELNKQVRIRSDELQTLFKGVAEISSGMEKWLNPRVAAQTTKDVLINLKAQSPQILGGLNTIHSTLDVILHRDIFDYQYYKSAGLEMPFDGKIRVLSGEILSLAQMRAQVARELLEWSKVDDDRFGHLIDRLDIIHQALKSMNATLDEIRERNLEEISE